MAIERRGLERKAHNPLHTSLSDAHPAAGVGRLYAGQWDVQMGQNEVKSSSFLAFKFTKIVKRALPMRM